MDRQQLRAELMSAHERFTAYVLSIPADQLILSRNGKWSPVQHMHHIHRSVRPVALALLAPKWFLRWRIGKPNRPSRTYDELVARYKEKLAAGGAAPAAFVPPQLDAAIAVPLSRKVLQEVERVRHRLKRWSEAELDNTLLPHPLLGKVTVREMVYFTIYHVQHHQALVERDLH
jgi:hypothetical protein